MSEDLIKWLENKIIKNNKRYQEAHISDLKLYIAGQNAGHAMVLEKITGKNYDYLLDKVFEKEEKDNE